MAVNIFIMRHGEAQPVAPTDAARELTAAGRKEVEQSARYLAAQVDKFDLVLVSPYIRAQQTWQIVSSFCPQPEVLQTVDELVPEASPEALHDFLDALIEQHQSDNILLVSHMPLVSYLVSELSTSKMAPIYMTAAVGHVSYDPQRMKGDFTGLHKAY